MGAFRPRLAAAQAEGVVTPEQVGLIDAALRKVDHCDPAAVTAGESLLVEAAGKLGPKDLAVVAARVVDAIDPDGVSPADEREHQERRFFHLKHRGDGSWAGDFRLTLELGQKLHALLGPLMAPQTTRYTTGDGDEAKQQVEADTRTHGQRRHDAVEAMVDRLLRGGDLPESGGIPTTLLIVMSYADYLAGQGVARYADGTPLSVPNALRLADQADLVWCVKAPKGGGAGSVPVAADRVPGADVGVDRPRRWLLVPGLRGGAAVVRTAPHHPVAGRWGHQPRQFDPAVSVSPPPLRTGWLDLPTQHRRAPGVAPTEVDRPTTTTDPEPTHHRRQLEPPRPPRPQLNRAPEHDRRTKITPTATGRRPVAGVGRFRAFWSESR